MPLSLNFYMEERREHGLTRIFLAKVLLQVFLFVRLNRGFIRVHLCSSVVKKDFRFYFRRDFLRLSFLRRGSFLSEGFSDQRRAPVRRSFGARVAGTGF
jgi:hypothetical protein